MRTTVPEQGRPGKAELLAGGGKEEDRTFGLQATSRREKGKREFPLAERIGLLASACREARIRAVPHRFVNKIIQGDCCAILRQLPDNSVDVLLTDPPYGMQYRAKKWGKPMQGDGDLSWFPPFIQEAYRLLKPNTHAYLFCNEYGLATFRSEMAAAGFKVKRLLVWVKDQHTAGDLGGDYANRTEYLLFGHKGRRKLNGHRDTNVLFFKRAGRKRDHPTEKPEDILRYLIQKSSAPGELVLDPFAGSGSTCKAAKDLGRRFLGIEIDPRYAEIARQRVADEYRRQQAV
jgi:site-specific DNA-methyltransferase (adenine-specific)